VTVKNTRGFQKLLSKEMGWLKIDFSIVSSEGAVKAGLFHKETKPSRMPHRSPAWWQQTVLDRTIR